MNEHANVTTIADALRQLADRFEATPVRDFDCPVWLQVDLQAVKHTGRPAGARRDTVDLLATVLDLGAPDVGNTTYSATRDARGVQVTAYTGATDDGNRYVG